MHNDTVNYVMYIATYIELYKYFVVFCFNYVLSIAIAAYYIAVVSTYVVIN